MPILRNSLTITVRVDAEYNPRVIQVERARICSIKLRAALRPPFFIGSSAIWTAGILFAPASTFGLLIILPPAEHERAIQLANALGYSSVEDYVIDLVRRRAIPRPLVPEPEYHLKGGILFPTI